MERFFLCMCIDDVQKHYCITTHSIDIDVHGPLYIEGPYEKVFLMLLIILMEQLIQVQYSNSRQS